MEQWISADVYCDTQDGILGTNMYAYCQGDPVNLCDPGGSKSKSTKNIVGIVDAKYWDTLYPYPPNINPFFKLYGRNNNEYTSLLEAMNIGILDVALQLGLMPQTNSTIVANLKMSQSGDLLFGTAVFPDAFTNEIWAFDFVIGRPYNIDAYFHSNWKTMSKDSTVIDAAQWVGTTVLGMLFPDIGITLAVTDGFLSGTRKIGEIRGKSQFNIIGNALEKRFHDISYFMLVPLTRARKIGTL